MIAHYLLHLYNGNIESNGIQPCYFLAVYTGAILVSTMRRGIQPCYFWVVYTTRPVGGNTLPGIQPCYFWAVYIPSTGIQLPKVLVVASHVTTSKQSIPASTTTKHLHRR